MSEHSSFLDRCLEGLAFPEDIDDAIDEWHDSSGDERLHAALGMTQAEYRLWVEKPGALGLILYARKHKRTPELVVHDQAECGIAARSRDSEQSKLLAWLKDSGRL